MFVRELDVLTLTSDDPSVHDRVNTAGCGIGFVRIPSSPHVVVGDHDDINLSDRGGPDSITCGMRSRADGKDIGRVTGDIGR